MSHTVTLADSHETGRTGILHIKRLWSKTLLNIDLADSEWMLDNALLNMLGVGLLPAFDFLHTTRPSFDAFEQWISSHFNNDIPAQLVHECNTVVLSGGNINRNATDRQVLSPTDLLFWKENGYVIIPSAIPEADCIAAANAVWSFLGMDSNLPATWYKKHSDIQGIMVQLFRHPALDKNRYAPRIQAAYEQLWGHSNLTVTTDKTGFNPPETDSYTYRGIGLHWDVSLAPPIPFGTQGILYLTDTEAHQGALTLVPGFHNIIDEWLRNLPPDTHPRNTGLQSFNPRPIPAKAGDFIIWHHALPHGASPNRATTPRIVQYINWFDPAAPAQATWI